MADYSINPDNIPNIEDMVPDGPVHYNLPMPTLDGLRTVVGGYGTRLVASLPAIVPDSWAFLSNALKFGTDLVTKQDGDSPFISTVRDVARNSPFIGPALQVDKAIGFTSLPGAEAARDAAEAIHEKATELGSAVAGRKLEPGLFTDNSAADKIGTALDLVGGLIPLTGGPAKLLNSGFAALKEINTGHGLIDKAAKITGDILPFMSPVVATNKPGTVLAINAAIGTPIQASFDVAQNKEIEEQKKQLEATLDKTNEDAKAGSDQTTAGIGAVMDANKEIEVAHAVENVQTGNVPDGEHPVAHVQQAGFFNPDDISTVSGWLGGLSLILGAGYLHRTVIREKGLQLLGGKVFAEDATKGIVSKPTETPMTLGGVGVSQAIDATHPVTVAAKSVGAEPGIYRNMMDNIAAAPHTHSVSLMERGEFADSRVNNVPLKQYFDMIQGMRENSPQKLDTLRQYLNNVSERNNRVNIWNESLGNKSVSPSDPKAIAALERWQGQVPAR